MPVCKDPLQSSQGRVFSALCPGNPDNGQWFLDLWREGRLAESAWDGFLKARKYGTYKIQEIPETGTMVRETSPLKR